MTAEKCLHHWWQSFNRTSCKKTELGSKVLTTRICVSKRIPNAYFKLEWWKYIDSCKQLSAGICKTTNIIGPVKDFDNRTLAGKRRKLAQTKAPEAMMALLDTALSVGLNADYVLFDSWFQTRCRSQPSIQKAWMWLLWSRRAAGLNTHTVVNSWVSKKSIPRTKSAMADQNICCLLMLW